KRSSLAMNIQDVYKSMVELLTWDAERFAAFLTGLLAGIVAVYLVWRLCRRKMRADNMRRINEFNSQMSRFKADNEMLAREKAALKEQLHQVDEENAALKHRLARGIAGGKKLVEERKNLQVKVEELS